MAPRAGAHPLCTVQFSIGSSATSPTTPSPAKGQTPTQARPGQLVLLRDLVGELRGARAGRRRDGRARVRDGHHPGDEHASATCRSIGFIAHVDTSPEMSGAGVKPIVHRGYDGSDLGAARRSRGGAARRRLAVPGRVPRPRHRDRVGHDAARRRQQERRRRDHDGGRVPDGAPGDSARSRIRIAFTPDEEVGHGTKHFDVPAFGARCAYTMDGGARGELEFESFSADAITVTFRGLQHAPRLREGPHGERDQAGGALHRAAACRSPVARDDRRAARASCTRTSCRPASTARR